MSKCVTNRSSRDRVGKSCSAYRVSLPVSLRKKWSRLLDRTVGLSWIKKSFNHDGVRPVHHFQHLLSRHEQLLEVLHRQYPPRERMLIPSSSIWLSVAKSRVY